MKLRLLACGFGAGVALSLLSGHVLSQPGPGDDPGEAAKMMRLWQKYATPGEHHKKLDYFVGEWDATTRIWMNGTGQPPTESTAVITYKKIFGGRFLETRMEGTMRFEVEGAMIEVLVSGVGYTGYDNFKKKYVSFWIDNNNTVMYVSEGLLDETGKVFTYYGTMDEWMTGEHDKPFKLVDRIVDENNCVSELHDLSIVPGETKVMEVVGKRRQQPTSQPAD